MNVKISTATQAQSAEIIQLIRASITELCAADHGNQSEPLAEWLSNKTTENMHNWLLDSTKTFIIARISSQISDQIIGMGCANNSGRILMNYVHPEYRFIGVSKAIMQHLESHLQALGIQKATLESSKTAYKFYQSMGWQNIETSDDKIEMLKHLQQPI